MTRPTGVTLITLMVLTIGVINLIRFWQTIKEWQFLEQILPISPIYLALSGIFWGIMGVLLAWDIYRASYRALLALKVYFLVYFVYVWVDRLLVSQTPNRAISSPFMAVFTVVVVAIIFWIASRDNVKEYFGETHE